MADRAPEMLKPTLFAGSIFGALAGLPYLDVLNACACCGLVWICGFTASALYAKRCKSAGVRFGAGNGALVGLIAALFYAIVVTLVGTLSKKVAGAPGEIWLMETMRGFLEAMLESGGDIPEQSIDQMEQAMEQIDGGIEALREGVQLSVFDTIFGFFKSLLVGAVFSTLGGTIGGVVFKNEPQPAAPAATQDEGPRV